MDEFGIFKDLISKSAKKNGKDKTLTLGHLENLLNMTSRIAGEREVEHERLLDEAYNDAMGDHYGDSD